MIAAPNRQNGPLALLLLTAACGAPPSDPPDLQPREVVTLARWDVFSAGQLRGQIVHLEIRDPAGPVRFYRIEDPRGRWVGQATENGRFTRRTPFDENGEDLGVLSMKRGVAELFEATAVDLRPVAADADWRQRDR
ncbi:MAG: hypothetical protein H6835_04770 [Planctomycetes bacterium]|nr:hypothetical protein [Planctomycetota bacterium]